MRQQCYVYQLTCTIISQFWPLMRLQSDHDHKFQSVQLLVCPSRGYARHSTLNLSLKLLLSLQVFGWKQCPSDFFGEKHVFRSCNSVCKFVTLDSLNRILNSSQTVE